MTACYLWILTVFFALKAVEFRPFGYISVVLWFLTVHYFLIDLTELLYAEPDLLR